MCSPFLFAQPPTLLLLRRKGLLQEGAMLLAWGTNSDSVDKDPKPPLEQGGVSGRVFTWVLVRKHRESGPGPTGPAEGPHCRDWPLSRRT